MRGSLEGLELFEHLSLGQVLGRTFVIFVDRLDVYLTLGAVVLVPKTLLMILLTLLVNVEKWSKQQQQQQQNTDDFYPSSSSTTPNDENPWQALMHTLSGHMTLLIVVSLIEFAVSLVTSLVGEGAIVRAVADTYAATPRGWYSCLRGVWGTTVVSLLLTSTAIQGTLYGGAIVVGIWFKIAAASHVVLLGFLGFLLLLAYLGALVYVWVSTRLCFSAIVVEDKGPLNSIRRSFELSEHRRCYVFCSVFSLYLIRVLVGQLIMNIFLPNRGDSSNPLASLIATPAALLIALVLDLVYLPLNSILKMVVYASIRSDKEGLTQAVLQRELDRPDAYEAPSTEEPDYRQVSLMEDP